MDSHSFGGKKVSNNQQVPSEGLEEAVWKEVVKILENPYHLREEYNSG